MASPAVEHTETAPLVATNDESYLPPTEPAIKPIAARGKTTTAFLAVGILVIMGMLFGTALEKSRVFDPYIIRSQFVFSKNIMLKTFLAAGASGMLTMLLARRYIPWFGGMFVAARVEYEGCLNRGLVAGCGGAFLLGSGMAVAGACPGMVLAQVGTRVTHSLFTLLGGLIGALMFGLFQSPITRRVLPLANMELPSFLDPWLNIGLDALTIRFMVPLILAVGALEYFLPWQREASVHGCSGYVWQCEAWPPALCGIIIGSLQVPCIVTVGQTLGSSTSYFQVMSQCAMCIPNAGSVVPGMASRLGSDDWLKKWWQVIYVTAVVLGAGLSASASGTIGITPGVPTWAALLGGCMMVFGARLAGGCTSGHGISGMALMCTLSMLAVPAMFAGGIMTAVIMRGVGVLDFAGQHV